MAVSIPAIVNQKAQGWNLSHCFLIIEYLKEMAHSKQ